MRQKPTVLLVQPPIYDFTAFDAFVYPLGLLEAAVRFEAAGFRPVLVDALDRCGPLAEAAARACGPGSVLKRPTFRRDGCGHFFRQRIAPPPALRGIPRRFHRFGAPREELKRALAAAGRPALAGVTCTMTYWYLGVREVVELLHELFQGVPVVLGGVYASLCPEHALEHTGVDAVASGGDLGLPPAGAPAHGLVGPRETAAVRASRGCPFRCTYCAAHRLAGGGFERRPVAEVLDELSFLVGSQGRRHIAFHDDALLAAQPAGAAAPDAPGPPVEAGGGNSFLELADGIAGRNLQAAARFHTVNGINAAAITPAVAEALKAAGFQTLRLGFETADRGLQAGTGGKTTSGELAAAVGALRAAGFAASDLGVYVMAGLPGQEPDSIFDTIRLVHRLGVPARITEFAPVPGTPDFVAARRVSRFDLDEPLHHNKCLAPYRFPTLSPDQLRRIKDAARAGNEVVAARG